MPKIFRLSRPDSFTIADTFEGKPVILKNGRVPATKELAPLIIALTNHLGFSGGNIDVMNNELDQAEGVL